MASLGDASISKELTEIVLTAAGKEYSSGSTYDIEFKGPSVKLVEYDENGLEVSRLDYTDSSVISKLDLADEMQRLKDLQAMNKLKRVLYYSFLGFVAMSCVVAVIILQLLKKGV